jgi:hypothetical protein
MRSPLGSGPAGPRLRSLPARGFVSDDARAGSFSFVWRPDDEALLRRLEDEAVLERLFRHHVGALARRTHPHPRAAGLIASARALEGGEAAVLAAFEGDVAQLAQLLEARPMRELPPAMLHHVALYYAKVASSLESAAPDAAANAWMRALAAWLALGEERTYLTRLEEAVAGDAKSAKLATSTLLEPERVPLEIVADLGKRAESASRDLAPSGRAALLALSWVDEAARIAGVSGDTSSRAQQAAERRRNAALDAALSVVGEALDEAHVQGQLASSGRALLLRALQVWTWAAEDEAVEQFVVDRLATIGWELYRARSWDALRYTFEPFRPLIEHFAARIETDPSKIAFAAPCAQMFVFLTDIEPLFAQKLALAERAVRICPSHRNGRLNLASLLCDEAIASMGQMILFASRAELGRVEKLLERAESLYPQSTELPAAKATLLRVKKGRIAL